MMSDKENKLKVFGYGIALIIPFLICLQMLKHSLSLGIFMVALLGGFVALLIIISRISSYKPIYNLWIPIVQLNVAVLKVVYGTGIIPMVLLGIALAFYIVTSLRHELLAAPYGMWMKVAAAINFIVSSVLMSIIFFLVFAPVGLALRLVRKDLLDQKIEPERGSYWIKREAVTDKERYKNQF